MIVIGLTGPIGTGKDAVSDYLEEKHDFDTFSCGDAIRQIAQEEGLEPNRENLQMLGKKHRKKEGEGFLGKKAAEMARESASDRVAVNGIRNPEEVEELKKELGNSFTLAYVHAEKGTRFERLKSRGRSGDPETFEEFEKQDRSEIEKFSMEETFSRADEELKNEGSFEELHDRIDQLLVEIKQ